MKYKIYKREKKNETAGGSYWRGADFKEHLKLTSFQTTYIYLLNNYPPPQKILEAGCGLGRWVIPLSEKNYDVTGIEIEEEAINTIKKNYNADNLNLVNGNIFNMKFADKTFDLILSLGVLEHFEDEAVQKKAILEHIRVLKDEGTFLITVPNLSFLRFIIHMPYTILLSFVRLLKRKKQYFAEYRYTTKEFKKNLEKCGLKIVDIVYDELLPPYNFGLIVDYPINRLFRSKDGVEYKMNKTGNMLFKFLWKINPKLVSGGTGYICRKK